MVAMTLLLLWPLPWTGRPEPPSCPGKLHLADGMYIGTSNKMLWTAGMKGQRPFGHPSSVIVTQDKCFQTTV